MFSMFGDVFNSFLGIQQMKQGQQVAMEAGDLQIQQLQQSIDISNATANYNNQLEDLDTNRKLKDLNSQTTTFISSQQASAVQSGFSSSSGSFLALYNDTLAQGERTANRVVSDSSQRKEMNTYQARVNEVNAQNQITAVNMQMQAQKFQSSSSILSSSLDLGNEVLGKLIPNTSTILGL